MLKSTQNVLFNVEYFHNYFKEPTFDTQFTLLFLYLYQLPYITYRKHNKKDAVRYYDMS